MKGQHCDLNLNADKRKREREEMGKEKTKCFKKQFLLLDRHLR